MSETSHPFFDAREHGFVRVATATPASRPADVAFNTAGVLAEAHKAHEANVDLLVFPELSLTGYYPADLLLRNRRSAAPARAAGEGRAGAGRGGGGFG